RQPLPPGARRRARRRQTHHPHLNGDTSLRGFPMTFRMTPAYEILLRGSATVEMGLYHLHLATAEQLCRLHYSPASLTLVKKRLKELVDAGYIQFDIQPSKEVRKPYYYSLTGRGVRYLRDAGMDEEAMPRPSKLEDTHGVFIDHEL